MVEYLPTFRQILPRNLPQNPGRRHPVQPQLGNCQLLGQTLNWGCLPCPLPRRDMTRLGDSPGAVCFRAPETCSSLAFSPSEALAGAQRTSTSDSLSQGLEVVKGLPQRTSLTDPLIVNGLPLTGT